MINRVTDTIKFNMITNSMFKIQGQYGELMEKLSTQKNVNRASDDPITTNKILDYRTILASIGQYQSNITDATSWLKLTETNINGLRNIADEALSIAISESGANGSPETREASLANLNSLIDEALSLLNAQSGDNYLFAGSATDTEPFSATYTSATVGAASAAVSNQFNGTVTSVGTYTGTENKTYAVRITGGTLAAATYAVSSDGGATWTATGTVDLSTTSTISVGDGISLQFTAGTQFATGDTFTVSGTAAGYYRGNDDKLTTVIGKNNNMEYNITGAEAFTGQFASAAINGIVQGSIANTAGGSSITAATAWSAIDGAGVADGDTISISGFDHEGNAVSGTYTVSIATDTVQDLLDEIENVFGNTVTASVDNAGRITVTDNVTGAGMMEVSLTENNEGGGSLDFGSFSSYSAVSSTDDATILLTRGATAGSWVITGNAIYPSMVISTQTTESITIDLDNDGTDDISVDLTGEWSQNDTISVSVEAGSTTGDVPATFGGTDSIDLLATLNALKVALEDPNQDRAQGLITAQIENLQDVGTQLLQYETKAGAKMQSMEVTSSNHNSMDLQITNMLADIENADLTKLITEFQMKEIAMEASYNMASQIGKMTIMDYI